MAIRPREVLAETPSAVLPLVPDLGAPRWLSIAVALARIAVAITARSDAWTRGRR